MKIRLIRVRKHANVARIRIFAQHLATHQQVLQVQCKHSVPFILCSDSELQLDVGVSRRKKIWTCPIEEYLGIRCVDEEVVDKLIWLVVPNYISHIIEIIMANIDVRIRRIDQQFKQLVCIEWFVYNLNVTICISKRIICSNFPFKFVNSIIKAHLIRFFKSFFIIASNLDEGRII